ncbi:aryl-sulfate sulfotransferase [Brucella sp. IR073]|uniref:aryl-sulfate sulfotransferase n=1 Tax=unclassified Brucella TaxID=2632610 RepID=UPI003B9817A5
MKPEFNWHILSRAARAIRSSFGSCVALSAIVCLALAQSMMMAWAIPSIYPTGVTIYDPSKAYNCFVGFSAPDWKTYIIDMDGNAVKTWPRYGFPSVVLDPKLTGGQKGHVLLQLSSTDGTNSVIKNKTVGELDWKGDTVWQWGSQAPGGAVRQNHDIERLPNGDTLILSTFRHVVPALSKKPIDDQVMYEVTPDGRIIWRYLVSEHLKEFGISKEGLKELRSALADGFHGFGFLTINDMRALGPNKWFESGDKRFAPDNIMFDSREANFIAIIDKKTGHLVWRLGPNYEIPWHPAGAGGFAAQLRTEPIFSTKIPRAFDRTAGQHDAHMIPEGLPGAGNILVFDNEGPSGIPSMRISHHLGSRVLEINPVTKQIVWQYTAEKSGNPPWTFYSAFISSARRLPNGNTLIDEGMDGRLFQVTPDGKIVWEYINPHFGTKETDKGRANLVYRAQPIPYDWLPDGTPHAESPVTPAAAR